MCTHVPPQPYGCQEAFPTEQTAVGLLPGVRCSVHVEVGGAPEALLTERTLKGLRSAVDQQVPVQGLQLGEALGALGADVRPPPGVGLPVLVQKPRVREALPTLAGERPCARVLHLVSLEVRGAAVDLVAQGALVPASHHVALSVSQPLQDAAEALATFLTSVPATLLLCRRHHLRC